MRRLEAVLVYNENCSDAHISMLERRSRLIAPEDPLPAARVASSFRMPPKAETPRNLLV
jgi:hypothetical protein